MVKSFFTGQRRRIKGKKKNESLMMPFNVRAREGWIKRGVGMDPED